MCYVIGVGPRKLPSGNLQKRLHCRIDFSNCLAVKIVSKYSAKTGFHFVKVLLRPKINSIFRSFKPSFKKTPVYFD